MESFKVVNTLSKNKVSLNDKFIIDFRPAVVTNISKKDVTFDNGMSYPIKNINAWIRLEYNQVMQKEKFTKRKQNFKKFVEDFYNNLEIYQDTPITCNSYILYKDLTTDEVHFVFGKDSGSDAIAIINRIEGPKNVIDAGYYVTHRFTNHLDQTVVTLYPIQETPTTNKSLEKHIWTWELNHPSYQLKVHENFRTLK